MKKLFTISICLFAITFFAKAQTNIPALITSNTTWGPSGNPYLLTKNSYVDTGVTLTILPGTIIKSTANYLTLSIDGEFIAKGTANSRITIDSIELKFSQKSKDIVLDYCDLAGRGSGSRILNIYGTNLKVTNSKFTNGYYGIYSISSAKSYSIIVDNCLFDFTNPRNYKQGYPIYTSGSLGTIKVTNSVFDYFYSMYVYGTLNFEKNTFNDYNAMNFYAYGPSAIKCNQFTNGAGALSLTEYSYYDSMAKVDFQYNTLDTVGGFGFSKSNPDKYITRSKINNNNFLYFTTDIKANISGYNTNKLTSEMVNLKSNYWGTTDSAKIDSLIRDYNDDINKYGRADFSNYLSSKVIGCGSSKPCKAGFEFTVDFDSVSFVDTSFSVNGHSVSWSFGDNSTGSGANVGHTYVSSGSHTVCMYIYDAVANCRDTVCQTVTTYDLPKYPEPSFYVAEDTSMKTNLYIIDDSKNTTLNTEYYWEFGDGSDSYLEKPTHTFTTNGPFNLCLTLSDSKLNSSKKYCNSVQVDNSGTSGFTIDVLKEWEITDLKDLNKLTVEVYPNPSSGKVSLQFANEIKGEYSVEVINNMGKVVYKLNSTNYNNKDIEVDLSSLSNGLYHVVIRSNSKIGNANFLINK